MQALHKNAGRPILHLLEERRNRGDIFQPLKFPEDLAKVGPEDEFEQAAENKMRRSHAELRQTCSNSILRAKYPHNSDPGLKQAVIGSKNCRMRKRFSNIIR